MVAIGRGLLTDAFWVKKLVQGRPEHIRPCIGCHDGCMGRIFLGRPLSCAVNPIVGRERTYGMERAQTPRKVMVIGGGVAGLEAARTSASRGHRVTLHEKTNALGGHLIEASVPEFKKDLARLLDWYKVELEDLDLTVKLNSEVTPALVDQEKPDAIIAATGSKPIMPEVPGIDKSSVATATDLLLGRKTAGNTVVVIGGGLIGCETALWLAQQGKSVTIVEMLNDLMVAGIPVPHMNRIMLLDLLAFHGVGVMNGNALLEVTDTGVMLIDKAFKKKSLAADTVAIAIGLRPDQELYKNLRGKTPDLYVIGDAREARNIMGSIWDAYEVARAI